METYVASCKKCTREFIWNDRKTTFSLSEVQIEAWRKRMKVCHDEKCGGELQQADYRRWREVVG